MFKKGLILFKALLLVLMLPPLYFYHEQGGLYAGYIDLNLPAVWAIVSLILPVAIVCVVIYFCATLVMTFVKKYEPMLYSDNYREIGVVLFWLVTVCIMIMSLFFIQMQVPLGG